MHSSRMRTARLLTVSQHALMGGVPALRYTCLGGVPAWGMYLPRGMYLCTCPEGVPAGGCTCLGGVCTCRGCTYPGTPHCEQNDRQVQIYYLAPNFFCGR